MTMRLRRFFELLLVLLLLFTPLPAQRSWEEVEFEKFREIQAKQRRGETLAEEERIYLERARELRGKYVEEFRKANPSRPSTGLQPLTELGSGKYKGYPGGLYLGGSNTPPQAHLKAGISIAKSIEALDRAGEESSAGKIVFMSVGMSNTTQEFQAFLELAEKDPEINPQLLLVDGAQGGQAAENTVSPSASYWKFVDQRLADAGATREQVQVVWIKQATREPRKPFPTEARNLQSHLTEILHVLNERFTNLKIAYVSSRIYAGYAVSPLSPEPHSYETGFAVKWLIEDQIAGKPELNHDAEKGTVASPWLAWGPYLWADGLRPRGDGLTYRRDDLAKDGIHPATTGRRKVADLLLRFLKIDPTAKPWFFRPGSRTIRYGNRG